MNVRFSEIPGRERYRWMIAAIVPRPIAFVSTVSPEGVTNLAPFSFFNGVSSEPPVLSVAISRKRDGSEKDTWRNIEATGEFVVNIAPVELAQRVVQASGEYDYGASEFDLTGLTPSPSQCVTPPRVAESPVSFECRLLQIVRLGEPSTALILGEILLMHVADAVLTSGRLDVKLLDPLARLGGLQYASLGDAFELARPKL